MYEIFHKGLAVARLPCAGAGRRGRWRSDPHLSQVREAGAPKVDCPVADGSLGADAGETQEVGSSRAGMSTWTTVQALDHVEAPLSKGLKAETVAAERYAALSAGLSGASRPLVGLHLPQHPLGSHLEFVGWVVVFAQQPQHTGHDAVARLIL